MKYQIRFRIQYPKLSLLACSFLLAYILYLQGFFDLLPQLLHGHGYISMFIGGLIFTFGFTSPFAVAIFIEMADTVHPILGALVAGLGAVVADMTIFQFIRLSFDDEIHRLKASALATWMKDKLHRETVPERIQQYIAWSIAGILIASPLPDELGVTMLSGLTEIRGKPFAAVCFGLNALGVFLILAGTTALA